MRRIFLSSAFLVCIAMVYGQERQVPIDQEGRVMNIDASLERRLGLFPEYRGLQDARLWQTSDTTYVLEILYQPEGSSMRTRIPFTQSEADALRERISTIMRRDAPQMLINQEGRTLFLTNATLVSLAYYGNALPLSLDIDDFRGYLALYMLTAGGGFFIPRAITKNAPMPWSSSIMAMYGQTRGILYGYTLPFIFDNEANYRTSLFFGLLGSTLGTVGAYRWAQSTGMTAGEAGVKTAMGDLGNLIGITTFDMFGLLDNGSNRAITSSLFLGTAGGLLTSGALTRNTHYTYGDALVLRAAAGVGAYTMLSLAIIFEPESSKLVSGLATVGTIGGIALGHYLAKESDFTSGEGFQTILGTSAGLFVGLGLGYLVSGDEFGDSKTIAVMSSLGAIGGFALMTNLFSRRSDKREQNISMNLNLNPLALTSMFQQENNQNDFNRMRMPLIQASFRF